MSDLNSLLLSNQNTGQTSEKHFTAVGIKIVILLK